MIAQPKVVIVVDDNAGLLKSVVRLLAHHGIDSRTFASAEALLASDGVQTATCLLLDIHLGGISGIELQRRLAASGSHWPVIFMTRATTRPRAMRRWTPDASPICASRSQARSCWMPLGKLLPNRRGATRARGVITSELCQHPTSAFLCRWTRSSGSRRILFSGSLEGSGQFSDIL